MKHLYLVRLTLLWATLIFLNNLKAFAQPVGATFNNPINAGTLLEGSTYTDTKNNSPQYGYQNNYGQQSDDIFYRFSIAEAAEVTIGLCSSNFDTYIHLLDASGNVLASNDDGGGCEYYYDSRLVRQLNPGTYYVVSEGWYNRSGNITTTISVPGVPEGDTPDAFYDKITSVFQNVDAAQISTGLLLDAGVEFANLENFKGTVALHDSNYVDNGTWRSIYGSLMSGKFNGNITFMPFTEINNRLNALKEPLAPTPMLLLNYNYQTYRIDALSAGLVEVYNEQIYDVPGRTGSPYETKTAFAIAPSESMINAPGGYASFVFKPELMFGNTGKAIAQLQVDFGNGQGFQNLNIGTAFTAHYTEGGIKDLNYQVNYTDNSIFQGHSKVYVSYANERETPGGSMQYYDPRFTDGNISVATSLGVKRATLQVRLSDNRNGGIRDNIIRKPLIVVEGIDFWRITNPENAAENTTIQDFINALEDRDLFNGGNLRDSIDLLSYDIIYVDFEDATDYLENNSKLVQAAISWVNNRKQALNGVMQQNVIMGLSMGGVLARHALRSMEINGQNHDTKLYISVDSPHQGANFPLGLQAFVKHLNNAKIRVLGNTVFEFKDQYPALQLAKDILDAPASRQLLKYRIGDDDDLGIDNSAHDNFYNNYHVMGMPACRSIAISNGSQCGTGQNFEPFTIIFDEKTDNALYGKNWGYQFLINLADYATSALQIRAGLLTNRPFIGFGSLLGLFSTRTSTYTDFWAKTLPDHQHSKIYQGRVGIRRRILWSFNVNSNLTNRSAHSASYMLPLDNAPGGETTFANGEDLGIPAETAQMFRIAGFCYVPTVSALDISNGATLSTQQLIAGYNSSNSSASPFSSVITAPQANENHVTFTQSNSFSLLNELKGNTQGPINCTMYCNSANQIAGSGAHYYITNAPSPSNITWSLTNSTGSISLCNTSGTFVNLFGVGTGTLQAVINSPCGNLTLPTKQIELSEPKISGFTSFCNGAFYSISNVPDNATVTWSVSGAIVISGDNTSQNMWVGSTAVGSLGTITATVSSPCLGSITLEKYVYTSPGLENFRFENGGSGTYPGAPGYDGGPISVRLDYHPNVYSYEWYVDGILVATTSDPFMTTYSYDYNACGIHDILVKGYTACGSPEESYSYAGSVFEVKCYYNNYYSYSVYPNPSSDEITVSTIDPQAGTSITSSSKDIKTKAKRSFDVKIYDKMGKVLRKGKSNDLEKVTLNTREIPEDTYFLHITEGKEVIKKLIIIKH